MTKAPAALDAVNWPTKHVPRTRLSPVLLELRFDLVIIVLYSGLFIVVLLEDWGGFSVVPTCKDKPQKTTRSNKDVG